MHAFKWVNQEGEVVLVKYHWEPLKQGLKNLTQKEAESIQAKNVSHATQDLYGPSSAAITRSGSFACKS